MSHRRATAKDCGHKVPGKARRPRRGCQCDRCESVRAGRRQGRKVENMTHEQRERRNAALRIGNMTKDQRESRNAALRIGNMTEAKAAQARAAGAKRSKLWRQRRAKERGE